MDYVDRMIGVDPRLTLCVMAGARDFEVASKAIVRVTTGLRSRSEQARLVRAGSSRTMNSYHLKGKAVNLAVIRGGVAVWIHDEYEQLNKYIQRYANLYGCSVTWGGSWATLVDAVHWQIETLDPAIGWKFPYLGKST